MSANQKKLSGLETTRMNSVHALLMEGTARNRKC
jgi:hypothetical protein